MRLIPFVNVWERFWASVKRHFFVFEERKVAIVYFYNSDTCQYVGPLYDAGLRFKKDECKKRYSLFGKVATVCDEGNISEFTKQTNYHQLPIPPLNVCHSRNQHVF